jgi:hypothetical protein
MRLVKSVESFDQMVGLNCVNGVVEADQFAAIMTAQDLKSRSA